MSFDAHKNFAFGHVSAAPTPADSGLSLVLVTGDALKFPATPFNATVYPLNTRPNPTNAEIVRVTNISGDVLTIARTQEGSGSRLIQAGDEFSATITQKTLTDIENSVAGFITPGAAFTGSLVFGTAASKVVPGATSLAFRNSADSANNLLISDAGLVTVRAGLNVASGGAIIASGDMSVSNGNLIFGAGTANIIPGATALRIRNNGNTVTHWSMTDIGQVTVIPETAATGFPGTNIGIQFGTTSNTYTTPQSTGSVLVRIDGNFKNTTDGTGFWRVLSTEAHWTDTALGASTFAGAYFNVYHDTATVDVQDIIGVIGRVFFTSTGKSSVGAWGVRGDLNFSGAADLTGNTAAAVVGHQGSWSAAATIPTYAALYATSHDLSQGGAIVTDGYGALIYTPINATRQNIGLCVGSPAGRTTDAGTLGLFVTDNGAWVRGQMAIPSVAYTGGNATMALAGGTHAGANDSLVALYFYRSTVAKNYIGLDGDSTSVIAGHTKGLDDFVLKVGKLVFDVNGQIYCLNRTTVGALSIIPVVATSGSMPSGLIYTGAAHTGLAPSSFAEFNYNAARTVAFDNSGTTVATAYQFQFQKVTYSAAAAMSMTLVATVRITGAPATSSSAGFAPTLVAAHALYIDAGSIGFGGAVNFVLDTTTGTKIGTATTQKLAFWNSTPVVQQVLATGAAHTADDIITFLQTVGLCKQS